MTRPGNKTKFDPVSGAMHIDMTWEEFQKACPEIAKHFRPLTDEEQRRQIECTPVGELWKPCAKDDFAYNVIGRAEEVAAFEEDPDD